nr:hypothetical protein [Cellulosimicrobium sp. MM]
MSDHRPARLPDGYELVPLTSADLRDVLDLDTTTFPSPVEVDELVDLPFPLTGSARSA